MSALHLSPQILDRAKLKLLHGTLAALHLPGDFADALLLDESHMNHPELSLREPVYQLKQHGVALDFRGIRLLRLFRRVPRFSPQSLKMVCNRVRRNAQEPRPERDSAPLE